MLLDISVGGLQAFLLTLVVIALICLGISMIWKALRGTHSHAFSQLGVAVAACIIIALAAGGAAVMQATGTSILGLFGI